MRDELDKLVATGKITSKHIEPLVELLEAGYCQHRAWGFGKITALDGALGRLNIDFVGKDGHSMDLAFATESLKAIPKDHILARKHSDLPSLKQEAALHHLNVVKIVLKSLGGQATVDQVMQMLVPEVIETDWKKWWEAARSEMKKDGHFTVPIRKTDPIIFTDEEIPLATRLGEDFQAARGLKAKVLVAGEILKSLEDLQDRSILADVVEALNADIRTHLETKPALALDGMFMRDDIRAAAELPAVDGELTPKDVWFKISKLDEFIQVLPAAKHRRTLESFRDCASDWPPQILQILNEVPAKVVSECARLLITEEKGQMLKDTLARLIGQHQASSELLLWLGKDRGDYFADILGPEVFRAMLTAIERDAFNEKKASRLHDLILDDQNLLPELIETADIEVIRDVVRTLQSSPAFDDMSKRSLLARVVKMYPIIQEMITGDQKKEDQTFLVSWDSLQRRKEEYDELVQKRIPANTKDIAIAKSYGDLRENHEYKSAKEMQKVLSRRKHELEALLARARGTDFVNPRLDSVTPGTIVHVTDLETGRQEKFSLLGAWDGDPDRNILSYLTPLAQSFINQPVGAEIHFNNEGHERRLRIDAIEAWHTAEATIGAAMEKAAAEEAAEAEAGDEAETQG
jgi:transcription elongation GreA/GreB family factor